LYKYGIFLLFVGGNHTQLVPPAKALAQATDIIADATQTTVGKSGGGASSGAAAKSGMFLFVCCFCCDCNQSSF
jgi:hypothetical protein